MKVLDLDKFLPEEKILKLGGREFDITTVPFIITLQVYEVIPIMTKIEQAISIPVEDYEKLLDVIFKVLQVSSPDLDRKWLEKNINIQRFNELMPFIFTALFDDGKKKETPVEVSSDGLEHLNLVEC